MILLKEFEKYLFRTIIFLKIFYLFLKMELKDSKIKEGIELLIEKNLEEMRKKINVGGEIDDKERLLCKNSMELYENLKNYNPEKLEEFIKNYNYFNGEKYAIKIPEKPKIFP